MHRHLLFVLAALLALVLASLAAFFLYAPTSEPRIEISTPDGSSRGDAVPS